jgi:hypothetical protein
VLLKRPDGYKLTQKLLDTVWGPEGMNTSSGRMMLVCLASRQDDTSSGWMEQCVSFCVGCILLTKSLICNVTVFIREVALSRVYSSAMSFKKIL